MIHVVAVGNLRRAAVAPAIMGNDAILTPRAQIDGIALRL
jgi:hypothetical protein